MAVATSGLIWLADPGDGRFLALSRSGQVLLDWELERRLSGFSGELESWTPDVSGGLYLVEGGRLVHLNAAGNRVGVWTLPEGLETGTLVLSRGRALLLPGGGPWAALPDGSLLGAPDPGTLLAASPPEPASP